MVHPPNNVIIRKRDVIFEKQKEAEKVAERAFLATIKKGSLQDKALALGTLTYNVSPALPQDHERPGTAPDGGSHGETNFHPIDFLLHLPHRSTPHVSSYWTLRKMIHLHVVLHDYTVSCTV